MLVAARSPVRAGLIAWPDRPGVSTIVVKQTYDVVPRGRATLADEQEPLCLELRSDDDVVLYPTDFAPAKSACDVVFVGAVLIEAFGPARLAADPVRKLVEHPRELGPRHGVGLDGDPTHPDVYRQWGNPTFDFDAFQCAPRDQRRPTMSLPMDIVYDLGSTRVSTSLEGPSPEAAVLDEAGWLAPKMVTLRADTVLIDPLASRISVLFRGVLYAPEDVDGLVVIESQVPLRSFNAHDMAGWPRAEAVDPTFLRRIRQISSAARSANIDDEASWGTTARLDSTTNVESRGGTSMPRNTMRDTVGIPTGASALRSMRDTVALSTAEAPTTTPVAAGPILAPPLRSPSFGAPPPIPSEPPPAAAATALPKARLGGLMMLPLETRSPPAPSSSPAPALRRPTSSPPVVRERRTSAPPFASPSEPPSFRTTVATLPEVVREPSALPFAPSSGSTASSLSPDATPFDPRGSTPLAKPPSLQRNPARTIPLPERDGPPTAPAFAPLRRSSTMPPPDGSSPGRPPTLPPPPAVLRSETPFLQPPIASVAAWSPPRLPVDFVPPPYAPPPVAPQPTTVTPPSPVAAPEPAAPSPRAAFEAPKRDEERDEETGLAHSDFVAIKAELWANPDGRARTLSARGLTDLEWRRVERRFAVKLGRRVVLASAAPSGASPLDRGS